MSVPRRVSRIRFQLERQAHPGRATDNSANASPDVFVTASRETPPAPSSSARHLRKRFPAAGASSSAKVRAPVVVSSANQRPQSQPTTKALSSSDRTPSPSASVPNAAWTLFVEVVRHVKLNVNYSLEAGERSTQHGVYATFRYEF